MPIPLLIISDAPSCSSGLGRITRDLASRVATHLGDVFEVACLGYAGPGSKKFPFQEYFITAMEDWVVPQLPQVWQDFAGDRRGIVMTIWDASRLKWFAQPETLQDGELHRFLKDAPFERWGYMPIDATGPHGKIWKIEGVLNGYDRLLAYSEFGAQVIEATTNKVISETSARHLPHGIDTSVFKPYDKLECKRMFASAGFASLRDDSYLVGIVATNQARKDFGLGIQVAAGLKQEGRDVCLWIHTDDLVRYWDIPSLVYDFGLRGKAVITFSNFADEQMAKLYSACDVTLGIGAGEGFGYPIFESLACGTPCIHGGYGGAAEHLGVTVPPESWRIEGQYNCLRPVFNADDWVKAANPMPTIPDADKLPDALAWDNLWPRWEQWFRQGAENFQ